MLMWMCVSRYKWGSYICPMSYYLAGNFANEFYDNETYNNDDIGTAAITTDVVSYSTLSAQFDYKATKQQAFIALLVFGLIYHLMWLFLMKMFDLLTNTRRTRNVDVYRRVIAARTRAKLLVSAGLRAVNNSANSFNLSSYNFGGSMSGSASGYANSPGNTYSYNSNSGGNAFANAEEDAYIELESGSVHSSPSSLSHQQQASSTSYRYGNASAGNSHNAHLHTPTGPGAVTNPMLSGASGGNKLTLSTASGVHTAHAPNTINTPSSLMSLATPSAATDATGNSVSASNSAANSPLANPFTNTYGAGSPILHQHSGVNLSPRASHSPSPSPFLSRLPSSQQLLQANNLNRPSLSAPSAPSSLVSNNNTPNNNNNSAVTRNSQVDGNTDSTSLLSFEGKETEI
jgi:hypothetical protein